MATTGLSLRSSHDQWCTGGYTHSSAETVVSPVVQAASVSTGVGAVGLQVWTCGLTGHPLKPAWSRTDLLPIIPLADWFSKHLHCHCQGISTPCPSQSIQLFLWPTQGSGSMERKGQKPVSTCHYKYTGQSHKLSPPSLSPRRGAAQGSFICLAASHCLHATCTYLLPGPINIDKYPGPAFCVCVCEALKQHQAIPFVSRVIQGGIRHPAPYSLWFKAGMAHRHRPCVTR